MFDVWTVAELDTLRRNTAERLAPLMNYVHRTIELRITELEESKNQLSSEVNPLRCRSSGIPLNYF
jgi:hypothetical protein